MKEYKVDLSGYEGKVREVVSEATQRHAFKLGYEWCGYGKEERLTSNPYLFFNKGCNITYIGAEDVRYFEDHRNIEISAADFLALTPEDVQGIGGEIMKPKFTPGPHRAERISGTSGQYLITDGKKHLALVPSGANARLYAAAPDMYEALEAAILEYGNPGGPWNVPSSPGSWIDKARAAIAKARGEDA